MNSIKTILVFLILAVIFSGCVQTNTTTNQNNSDTTNKSMQKEMNEMMNEMHGFNIKEIAKHNSEKDCWLLINGKVYDVTGFEETHSGGKAILEGCGKDATALFESRPMGSGTPHSDNARELLSEFYIGNLN